MIGGPGRHEGRSLAQAAASEQADDPTKSLNPTAGSSYPAGIGEAVNTTADWWSAGAQLAIRQLAQNGYFDADMLLDLMGEPPHSSYVGAAFASAWRAGVIEQVGCRVARDGRLVRIWFQAADESAGLLDDLSRRKVTGL